MSDRLKKIFNNDEHDLLKVVSSPKPASSEDRLEDSFLEINDFYAENGRIPDVNTSDINERKLGVRLRSLLLDDTKVAALKSLDTHCLLEPAPAPESLDDIFSGDQFGLLDDPTGILTIRNVPKDVKRPDQVARVHKAKNFDKFEPLFRDMHSRMNAGEFIRIKISSENQAKEGRFFVLNGVLIYIDDKGEGFASKAKLNAKLHVVYENGTESNILLRSLVRSLYRSDERGGASRVVPKNYKELTEWQDVEAVTPIVNKTKVTKDDAETGYIYVLRSGSDEPQVQDLINLYKIGFTTGKVEERIRNAAHDPTYLYAPVEIAATYKCYNMNTRKLEQLIHRFFADVKLDLTFTSPEGRSYVPSEWYIVPMEVLNKAIDFIVSGEIVNYHFDSRLRDIVPNDSH